MSPLILILIVLLIVAVFGGYAGPADWGYARYSPIGIILLIFVILVLTGAIR